MHRLGHHRRRRIGAHPAGIGAGIAVADPLVVLRRGQRQYVLAIDQREKAGFLAPEKLLDDDLGAGRAEAARREHHVDRGMGLGEIGGDDDPLPRRQPVGLDDDRRALFGDVGLGRGGVGKAAIGGGRDALAGAQILHKALRAFECRRRRARAEGSDPLAFERIDQAGDKRRLGTDDDEIDRFPPAELDDALGVARGDRDAFRLVGDSGIARRAEDPIDQRRGRDRPDQRMLAPARADDEYFHCGTRIALPLRLR